MRARSTCTRFFLCFILLIFVSCGSGDTPPGNDSPGLVEHKIMEIAKTLVNISRDQGGRQSREKIASIPLEERTATVAPPYNQFTNGPDMSNMLSVAEAAGAISKQAGLEYKWKASARNAEAQLRRWSYPNFKDKPWRQAMKEVLDPVDLTFYLAGDGVVVIKKEDLPKLEQLWRKIDEDIAYFSSLDSPLSKLHDAVIVLPLLNARGETTQAGTLLAGLGMLKATYVPDKLFNLHVPSVIDLYKSMGYGFTGRSIPAKEKERIKARFVAGSMAEGTLEIADDNTFKASLIFKGEHGKKEFSTTGATSDLQTLPQWIARRVHEYCGLEISPESGSRLALVELRSAGDFSAMIELEGDFQLGIKNRHRWGQLLDHNPDSVFALYRWSLIMKEDALARIQTALQRYEGHDLLEFLEAESDYAAGGIESSISVLLELLKTDFQNEAIHERLQEALRELGRGEDALSMLTIWCENDDSYLAPLARGRFFFTYDRGHMYPQRVPEDAWPIFEERIRMAEKDFLKAYELNPTDPRVPTELIATSYVGAHDDEETESWFRKAIQADPSFYRAYKGKLRYLTPKWYGSTEKMLAFGRECAADPPEGSRVALILAETHWFVRRGKENIEQYFHDPDVWAEIKAVYEDNLSEYPDVIVDHNYFAKYACYAGDKDEAGKQFEIIGNDFALECWHSERRFKRYRAQFFPELYSDAPEYMPSFSTPKKLNLNRRVSLKPPFTGWNPNTHDVPDIIALTDAVSALCSQAGLKYNHEKSHGNTDSMCEAKVSPLIDKLPWSEAMTSMLDPLDLAYRLEGREVVLTTK